MFVPSPLMGEGQDEGGTERQEKKFRSSTTFVLVYWIQTSKQSNNENRAVSGSPVEDGVQAGTAKRLPAPTDQGGRFLGGSLSAPGQWPVVQSGRTAGEICLVYSGGDG